MYNQYVSLYAASTYFKTYIILVMKSKYHVQIFIYAYIWRRWFVETVQDIDLIFTDKTWTWFCQKSGHKRQSSAAVWPKDIVKLTHQLEQLTKTRPPISWPRYCQVDLGNFNVEYVLAIFRRKIFSIDLHTQTIQRDHSVVY